VSGPLRAYGIDPSVELQRIERAKSQAGSIELEFLLLSAEDPVPAADATFDTVVVTWTLCSIPNASKALGR
jgi:ubiquinone/menaquinone biosynthesis C-methylase UbiE